MTNKTRAGIALLVLVQGLAATACGDASVAPNTMTAPSPTGGAGNGGGLVSGGVFDSAYRPLAGALVEALDGPRAGSLATADAKGQFSFPEIFDNNTRFRAGGEGHVAATLTFNSVITRGEINFYLVPAAPSANIAGEYTLTFAADIAWPRRQSRAAVVREERQLDDAALAPLILRQLHCCRARAGPQGCAASRERTRRRNAHARARTPAFLRGDERRPR